MRLLNLLSKFNLRIFKFVYVAVFLTLLSTSFPAGYSLTKNPPAKISPEIPKLTIDSIFKKQNDISKLENSKLITLVATGDVIPARLVNQKAVSLKNFVFPWEKTASFLKNADITLINLESPIFQGCPVRTTGMVFCGDSRHIEGIVFAGVDTVSLANNHSKNYGQKGIDATVQLLENNKIGWSGFGHLDIKTVKTVKFGFLSYNGVEQSIDTEEMVKEIREAKPKVDVLVVSVHWGKEYVIKPQNDGRVAPQNPTDLGRLIIEAGADLVIGNHPHWVQGVEIYKDKLISYAHGNFIFDQTWSQQTQEGVVGEYVFYEDKLVNVKYHPIIVDRSYQPRFLNENEGAHIIQQMVGSTNAIGYK